MMIAKDTIFREYDIRGVVGRDFDAGFAYELGRVLADIVIEAGGSSAQKRCRVGVGFDCRVSAPEMTAALQEGLTAGGVDCILGGMGPTPQLYYMVFAMNLDGGVQITASHNPGDQNGFKMMVGHRTLSGKDIQEIKRRVFQRARSSSKSGVGDGGSREQGQVVSVDARSAYIQELVSRSRPKMGAVRRVKVVVDGGNGVGGLVGPPLLRELGCEVIELYTEPDGNFPNHHPDPTVVDNLKALREVVLREKADVGIAWDGDADRIGIVDENAQPIFGDMLLVIFGRQLLKEVPHPKIIGDVKCSELMFSDLAKRGAETIMSKTGHSLIKAKLKEVKADLAGEMSGHMFFAHRYYGFDDALHASARLVEILSNTTQRVSEFLADLPQTVSTPELRVDCPDEIKFTVAERAKDLFPEFNTNALDGVRVTFPHGWGLVRASNTQACLVMRFEADTQAHLTEYQRIVEDRIRQLREQLGAGA